MPIQVSYPGVYIEEIPSSSHTVVSATTSATAFVGFFPEGPIGEAVRVNNFEEFTRTFGNLNKRSEASYAIYQYFNNGGQIAWVLRLGDGKQNAAALSPPVTVIQPSLGSLSKQAAAAANAAVKAAEKAQKDMVETKEPWQIAEDVAKQTQIAADQTRTAATATNAAGQELQLKLGEYEAEYGVEAESTLNAAEEAALAAQAAATAAAAAAAAADNALSHSGDLDQGPSPAAPNTAAQETQHAASQISVEAGANVPAQPTATATAKLLADLKLAAAGGTPDPPIAYASLGQVGAVGPAVQSDIGKYDAQDYPDLNKQLETILQATNLMLSNGLQATLAAQAATARATEAEILAANDSSRLTTAYAEAVDQAVQAVQGAAQAASAQATTLSSAVAQALLFADSAAASPPISLTLKQTDADTVVETADLALAWAQIAAAGSNGLVEAAAEAGESSDTGFSAIARSASEAAAQAAATGEELYPSPSDPNVMDLQSAADFFRQAAAKSPLIVDTDELGRIVSGLKDAATAASSDLPTAPSGSPPQPLDETAAFAAEALAAYLAGLVVSDVQAAVRPTDTVEKAILAAAEAAEKAAAKAQEAAAKARVADQAAQQDEAAAEGSVLELQAANPGVWGNSLQVTITSRPEYLFDLQVQKMGMRGGKSQALSTESYTQLTLDDPHAANYAPAKVNDASLLIQLAYTGPNVHGAYPVPSQMPIKLTSGADGGPPQAINLFPVSESDGPGLEMPLNNIAPNVFNILCMPVVATYPANEMSSALTQAQDFVAAQHAFMIVDIPQSIDTVEKMTSWMSTYSNAAAYYAAVYYPRLLIPDPLQSYRLRNVGPSGTIAGVYASNDHNYGVWETPAGINAVLKGAQIAAPMTDDQNGMLNPLGVNCLRNFAVYGNIVWGGRTVAGADLLDSEWKYVNVRRTADYVEQSLFQSLKWVVFENNDSRLWSQIRTEVGSFMAGLYSLGAFAGASASQAYLVKCDSTTTTQADIDNGIVNILVGFAPEKPAEFVILQLEQLAGQSAS